MPIIKKYDNSFDFKVEEPETDNAFGCTTFVFLKLNLCVQETFAKSDDEEEDYHKQTVYGIIESPSLGLCYWDTDDNCWVPVEDKVQKAYSDFIAEKELLNNPTPPKKSKK